MKFGTSFRVLKEMAFVYEKIGEGKYAPECFMAYNDNGLLEYCIMDDRTGQPSPANTVVSPYAIKMRTKALEILVDLLNEGFIEPLEEEI